MKTFRRIVLAFVVLVILGAAAGFAYVWFAGGSGQASAPAEAAPIQTPEPQSVVYRAIADESEARFLIEEVLRGQPNTVVGVTDQVDGSIAVRRDPGDVQIGAFVINVRTIRTDDEVRDRTIRTLILESNRDEFEFARFEPTAVSGVPDQIGTGDQLVLQVSGDLTVRDVTTPAVFAMNLAIESDDLVRGNAVTTITWEELEIEIPYVGGNSIVASVGEEVRLELEFVARAQR